MKIKRRIIRGAVVAAVLLCAVGIICDSKYDLQISQYTVSSDRLPPEFDGFRIVHLSDLHGARFGRENSRLISAVREQCPDMIALTGDFVTGAEDLTAVEELLRGIAGIAPAYFVCGNHEWASGCTDAIRELMGRYGVRCLSNEFEPLERDGARIIIAGAEDPNGRADMPRPDAFIESLRERYLEDFAVLLGHRNYWAEEYPQLPVQLILSGHAHGGIVRLPFLGGLLSTDHHLGAEYEAGLYSGGEFIMEVSRGLGNSISVPRIFNRPELVTVILRASNGQ